MRLGAVKSDQTLHLWKKGSCANLYFFIVNEVDDIFSPQFILKKINNVLSRALHNDWKNKVPDFSFENSFSIFNPKHIENTLRTLSNQSMTSRKYKYLPQNSKSIWTKNLLKLKYVFLGSFKVKRKKYLIWTSFITWNYLA